MAPQPGHSRAPGTHLGLFLALSQTLCVVEGTGAHVLTTKECMPGTHQREGKKMSRGSVDARGRLTQ